MRPQEILTADVIIIINFTYKYIHEVQVLRKHSVLTYTQTRKHLQSNDTLVPQSISTTTECEWTIAIIIFTVKYRNGNKSLRT